MKMLQTKLVICVLVLVAIFANCYAAETHEFNGHLYVKSSIGTWSQAEAEAVGMGGHLVAVNGEAEQDFIEQLLTGSTWIGFTDEGTEVWEWINGDPVTYTNWAPPYEPNGGTAENCAVAEGAWNGQWNDLPCDRTLVGIIEIDNVPKMTCIGFEPPMADFPVSFKRNHSLPLRAEIFDSDGYEITGSDLSVAPVVQIFFESQPGEAPIDISADLAEAGQGNEGNQFVFTEAGLWEFILETKSYTADGTYIVLMDTANSSEYIFELSCVTEFVVQ
jgi:hypothetical protein